MQIIQISDMHITTEANLDSIKSQISKLYDALKRQLEKTETIVFCILGDTVDKGDPTVYLKALDVLNYMKKLFSEFNPRFEFTPGNHDLCDCPNFHLTPAICPVQSCNLDHYFDFVKSFDSSYDPAETISHRRYDDVDLILASSISHGNCKYGQIDIDSLKKVIINKPTILVTHHTFFSESNTDTSAIRNAYKVFEVIEAQDIVGILHGHTHGYKDITLGNKCPVVGVGPFLKNIPNINHQVNLVSVMPSGIYQVTNFYYRNDFDEYIERIVYKSTRKIYFGTSIEKLYNDILLDTKKFGIIPDMHLKLEMSYTNFNTEIKRCFGEYIETANLWQETGEVPDSLYYNHGQYMQSKGTTAIEFIVKELKNKATSSRAVVPLIDFEMVVESGDGFLPSFDLVQFGFMEEEKSHLYVTLYLRALEVNHFLRINLCEIYLMCKQIASEIRSIDTIGLSVVAFKAQYKELFGCFKRAEIDMIGEAEIVLMLQENPQNIICLLEEKKLFNETVIEDKGICSFNSAIKAINKRKPIKTSIRKLSENILDTMSILKSERKKTSNYTSIEIFEAQLETQLDQIIDLFKKGEIYESK